MREQGDDGLDRAFLALADPVRRRIVARLSRGPATVNELAEPFEITKQAVSKHIQVLEHAELVTRTREAQRRPVHLNPQMLESLTAWIDEYRLIHERRFRRLDALLQTMQPVEPDEPEARGPRDEPDSAETAGPRRPMQHRKPKETQECNDEEKP